MAMLPPHPSLLPRGEGVYLLSLWERIEVRVRQKIRMG